MKYLLSLLTVTFSLSSLAVTYTPDENHLPSEEQQKEEAPVKKINKGSGSKHIQEQEKDADPEFNAIDDDLTEKEGESNIEE